MGDIDMKGEPDHKRKRQSEAQLIPGLGALEYGFPNSIITQLRYCDYGSLTSTSGGTASTLWRANGIYDPDYTNTGHQPLFRDAYANVYDYYTVLGSKIKVTFQSRNADYGFVVGLQGSDTPSLTSTVTTWMEQNNGVHTLVGNKNTGNKTLFMTYSPEEVLGSDTKDDNSSLTGVGSDPGSAQAYYFGLLAATEDATTTAIIGYIVEIEYTVKFTVLARRAQD
jgi:hypothetical protein